MKPKLRDRVDDRIANLVATRPNSRAVRLVQLIRANLLVTIAIVVALFLAVKFGGAALVAAIKHHREDQAVANQQQKANAAAAKGAEQIQEANQESIDRKAEDRHREQNLKPRLTHAARDVEAARSRTDIARRNYEEARNTRDVTNNSDISELRKRNCADLRELFPAESFEYCRDQ